MKSLLSIVGGMISLLNKLSDYLARKDAEKTGAEKQQLKDATDELKAIRDGNAAASDPDGLERVRKQFEVDRPA